MSAQQRASIENAIWLCKTCARKIDLDPVHFSPELLVSWKKIAEGNAAKNLGKPNPPSQAIETLTQALIGLPIKAIESALPNVATASKQALEIQNPYITVDVNYVEGVQKFVINPKEGMPPLKIQFSADPDLSDRIRRSLAEGLPFSTPDLIELKSNQPIFDGKQARISTDPDNKHAAHLKFFNQYNPADTVSVPGVVRIGKTLITFEGSLGNGFTDLKIRLPIGDGKLSSKGDFNFQSGNYAAWEGNFLSYLPDFPSIKLLHELLLKSGTCVEIYMNGHRASGCNLDDLIKENLEDFVHIFNALIHFDKELNLNCRFTEKGFLETDFGDLLFVYKLWIEGPQEELSKESVEIQIPIEASKIAGLKNQIGNISQVSLERESRKIEFFGKTILIPKITTILEGVLLTSCDTNALDGSSVAKLVQLKDQKKKSFLNSVPCSEDQI